jgi:hypothetical protein
MTSPTPDDERLADARALYRRVLWRGLLVGTALELALVAAGRAYLVWFEASHRCWSCGLPYLSVHVDWDVALRKLLIVPTTYAIGLATVYVMLRSASDGFAGRPWRPVAAVVAASAATLVALGTMPAALDAGMVANWAWVAATLHAPPLVIWMVFRAPPLPKLATTVRGADPFAGHPWGR